MARKRRIKSLYYITHTDNLPSMLQRGILSHKGVEEQGVQFTPIYDAGIVAERQKRVVEPSGNSLWEFANLYFQPRNPMLYRVISEKEKNDIAILGVKPQVLEIPGSFISVGNAASYLSPIVPTQEGIRVITEEIWDVIMGDWWREEDGSKRKIMAECLIPNSVSPDFIDTIYVVSHQVADRVKALTSPYARNISVVLEPHMFFQPSKRYKLTSTLSLVDGDMFFSQMQTLTISVNVVGIMGKGLASRAKYQFPDVYVFYQDLCRRKALKIGRPYLYKRETSLGRQLADDPSSFPDLNQNKWFLLFPTKRHWRENSDINGIEEGLQWLKVNYRTEGIQSLAIPALGCGLGRLDWRDVGPLLCKYLSNLEVPVVIYLPQEKEIAPEYLTKEFLLGSQEVTGAS
jgi:hypothetical protein